MGVRLQVLVSVLVFACPSAPTICDFSQCNCPLVANKWINAVCVFNNTQRQLDISPELLPKNLAELEISGPREMVLCNGSFSRNLTGLYLVRLTDVGVLTIGQKAFARLAHPHLILQVSGAQRVILESNAFHELKGSVVSVTLERVDHLIVQEYAFDRLLALDILQVGLLQLKPNAFYYEPESKEDQGPATKIVLDRVTVKDLPYNVFPPLNQLSILNSEVGSVRTGSFRAIILTTVRIVNTTIVELQTEAFTTRSGISLLELSGVTVGQMLTNCVQSGISKLTVRGSSFTDIHESAFHTTTATVSLAENMFNQVRSRGFTFRETTMLSVENNRFNRVDDLAFYLPEGESTAPINLTFRGNSLGREIGRVTLNFTRSKEIGAYVNNNSFDNQCHCKNHTKAWLEEKFSGPERVVEMFYETSLCHVNLDLSRCFSIPYGMFLMDNFSSLACEAEDHYYCPEVIQSDAGIPSFPGETLIVTRADNWDREKIILRSIFLFVMIGIVLMLFLSGFMWLRRNGYCTKARLLLLPSADSMWNIISRFFVGSTTGSGSSGVVNRTSVHEYAELQQVQKQLDEAVEDEISLEDKATQTLPEELTQELLQSLREKLDDPENYSEARDMIEHLYDLIKVEESCNQNSELSSFQLDDLEDVQVGENVYDVIQPKTKLRNRVPREKKSLVSVGTRAPSPDKLLPLSLSKRKPAVLCEYTEPRDQKPHVYQELPTTQPLASILCEYMEPPDSKPHVYLELSKAMVNRPLPSKPDQRLSDPGEGPSSR